MYLATQSYKQGGDEQSKEEEKKRRGGKVERYRISQSQMASS